MHRRSFLKGAAALAAAPVLPPLPLPAAPPVTTTTITLEALAAGAIRAPCLVVTDLGFRLYDSDGPARIVLGIFDEATASESRDRAIARGGVVVPA